MSDLKELFKSLNPNHNMATIEENTANDIVEIKQSYKMCSLSEEELTPKSQYPDPYEVAIAQVKEEIKDAKTNELWKDGFKACISLIEMKAKAIKDAQPLPF